MELLITASSQVYIPSHLKNEQLYENFNFVENRSRLSNLDSKCEQSDWQRLYNDMFHAKLLRLISGSEVYREIEVHFKNLNTIWTNDLIKGWLGRMNTYHNFSQMWYLIQIKPLLENELQKICFYEIKMRFIFEL